MAMQGGANIADILLSGSRGLANGIASAGQSVGSGIEDAGKQMELEKKRRGLAQGEAEFLLSLDSLQPAQRANLLKMMSGSTAKLEGAVGMAKAEYSLIDDYKKEQRAEERNLRYLDAQTKAAINLAGAKASLPRATPKAPNLRPLTDPTTGEPIGYFDPATGQVTKYDPNDIVPSGPGTPSATAAPIGAPVSSIPAAAPAKGSAVPVATMPKEGQRSINRATGEIRVFRNGSWGPQ